MSLAARALGAGLVVLLTAGTLAAQPSTRPTSRGTVTAAQPDAPTAARGQGGLLRGLDKITGATRDLPLRVGQAVMFGRLEVRMGECRFPAEDPGSDAYAELTITDTAAKRTVFSGWMLASSPALSALDDARYDVWVVSCDNSAAASGSAPATTATP